MEKVELEISGICDNYPQSSAYTLILVESGGSRKVPIIIGLYEAQSIAIQMENMKPARPLTHDLFKTFADTFKIKLNEVVIDKFIDGIFHSYLVFEKDNHIFHVDSRTSDAVALALRFNCPIYTDMAILNEVGVIFEEDDEIIKNSDSILPDDEDMPSLEELESDLNDAVENEDFERASRLRDEIRKFKENQ